MDAEAPALLLIGHGSRSPAGVAEYWSLLDVVRDEDPHATVGGGFIELARPDLDTAVDDLVVAGARSIVAVPLVLLGAGHLKDDGPAALGRARARHPDVELSYGRALDVHHLVLATAAERIVDAMAGWAHARTAVVLVGRGSTDPDANADLHKVARLLFDLTAVAMVEPSFVSLARPGVPDALERCRRLGASRVVVVPYFLFTGILVERMARQSRLWASEHGGLEVRTGRHLGPDPRIAQLVWERYGEAVRGEARMNCDCCVHRVSAGQAQPPWGLRVRFPEMTGQPTVLRH